MFTLNNKGQSTIEFLMTFIIIFGFIVAFLKISYVYTNGYIVQYITFLSSRSFLVHDNNENDPGFTDSAAIRYVETEVFNKYKLELLLNSFNSKLEFNSPTGTFTTPGKNLLIGVYLDYTDSLISPIPGQKRKLDLRSESFLGREPVKSECYQRICKAFGDLAGTNSYCKFFTTVYDNGC